MRQPPVGATLEELELTYVPPGETVPVRIATVLLSPTRFYIDLKRPEAFLDESVILAQLNGADQSAKRRRVLHELLERWLLKPRAALLQAEPVAPSDQAPPLLS